MLPYIGFTGTPIDPEFEEITEGEEESDKIVNLRPDWHSDDDDKWVLKIVISGSASDRAEWQPHIRSKPRREALAKRFKDKPGGLIVDYLGIAAAMEHILHLEDGKKRYLAEFTALSKAFALAVPHEEALKIRDAVKLRNHRLDHP